MPRKAKPKATTPAKLEAADSDAKAYRHTRTGAIRMSSGPLGYPYVPADSDAKAAAEGEERSA